MNRATGIRLAAAVCAASICAGGGLAFADARMDGEGVELPREVVAAASAFSTYMERTVGLSAKVTSADAVAEGLDAGAAYETGQFEEGMIGYAAIAALQDQAFVGGVDAASRRGEPRALADRLAADPSLVLQFEGAREAAARAQAALRERGSTLAQSGEAVRHAAYDVQKQAWSTASVSDAVSRLARVKSLSAAVLTTSQNDDARLFKTLMESKAPGAGGETVSPVIVRALALAADAVLGQAKGADLASLKPLLSEASSAQCLKMSKLNLYQCMAVAGPQYEDVFCLGQHALMDTGQCVAQAAGLATPAKAPDATPPAQTPVVDRPYLVPVAHRTVVAAGN